MKKIISILLAVILSAGVFSATIASVSAEEIVTTHAPIQRVFTDIEPGSDLEVKLARLKNAGIINGYEDGSFQPEWGLSRAEFCKMVNILFGFAVKDTTAFPDVTPDLWYYDQVLIAKKSGYIQGFEDGTFRGNEKVTREQVCVILDRILGCYKLYDVAITDEVSDWSRFSVEKIISNGFMPLEENSTFRAKQIITRAEFANVFIIFLDARTQTGNNNNDKPSTPSVPSGGTPKPPTGGTPTPKPPASGDDGDKDDDGTGTGTTTPPAGDGGNDEGGNTNPPAGDGGDNEGGNTNPPAGDGGDDEGGNTNPPAGDGGDDEGGNTNPPAGDGGDDEGGNTNPPAGDGGDDEGGNTNPPAGDGGNDEGGNTNPPAGDGGDDEGGNTNPPAGDGGDDEGGNTNPPSGDDDDEGEDVPPVVDMTEDDIVIDEMEKLLQFLNTKYRFNDGKEFAPFYQKLKDVVKAIIDDSETVLITPEYVQEEYGQRMEDFKSDYKGLCDKCVAEFNGIANECATKFKAVLVDYFYDIIPEEAFDMIA